ncbi:phage tail protein [Gilliamella apicola]|uniref:phage tail-collar fiber domain-containing protein n=1 Tax=Gilliamella apicola TaxID=1196095 RepID=UPI003987375E
MSQTYYTLLTKTGAILLANATALGVPLKLTHMAVGDGNGNMTKPDANQTKLIREVRRAAINTLFVDKENPNQIIAEQIIPEAEGGWFIHEIGLFDDKGNMIAIGNCPATYKPKLAEGSGRTQVIRMIIIVDNTQSIEIKIDPAVVLSTRQYVDDLVTAKMTNHEKSTDHPNATTKSKGFVQLNSSTDSNLENQAATPLAVKKAYDTASEATKKANDLMAAHEKSTNHPDATTKSKGFVQLNSSTDSNLENQAATPLAVKKAYDIASEAAKKANDLMAAHEKSTNHPNATTKSKGFVQLNSSTDSNLENQAATPLAVKKAYDLANGALKKSGDTMTGQLILPKNGLKISYDNKNIMALVTSGDNYSHVFYDAEKQKWLSKLVYGSTANTWSFQYVDDVLINNKSVLKIGDYGIGSFVGASLSNPDDVLPGGCYATRTTAFPELTEYKNRNDSASLVVLPSTTKNWRVEMLAIVHGAFPRIFFRCATINGKQPLHEAITTVNINNYIPVGIPLPWPTNQPPSGWFECNGSTFDKNQFPKLAAAYPAGSLPDLRGVFIRGMDNGRGLDPNRNILSYQDDAIRNIYGELSPISETFGAAHVASGAFEYFEKHSDHTPTSIDRGLAGGVTFDASRIVPTANENRPRNVAFMYIVKAE